VLQAAAYMDAALEEARGGALLVTSWLPGWPEAYQPPSPLLSGLWHAVVCTEWMLCHWCDAAAAFTEANYTGDTSGMQVRTVALPA
jgi:hypothetical protein